jgi:hypothetical protein
MSLEVRLSGETFWSGINIIIGTGFGYVRNDITHVIALALLGE